MVNLDHFSIVDTGHSTRNATKSQCPFNFLGQDSNTLVVTVGDSWTWGCDMTPDDNEDHRLKHHYGRTVADHLAADWLNLGQGGAGNFWICDKIQELSNLIPSLNYQQIYVICTFTETGRAIESRQDIDYFGFFQNRPLTELVPWLTNLCVDRIVQALDSWPQVTLVIGTNFVDWSGTDHDFVIKKPWIQLLCEHWNIDYTDQCHVVSSWAIEGFRSLADLTPNTVVYQLMLNDWIDAAIGRATLLRRIPGMTRTIVPTHQSINTGHPDAFGHDIWAQQILKHIEQTK